MMPHNPMTVSSRRNTTGLRQSTAATRATLAQADAFQGLPEGMTRWRLSAALRTAARHLDLSPMMLRLLEYYIDQTWDADWMRGSEPIVIRPLVETATVLGRTERQIRNIERALVDRGLLAWRDSGNHHRRGRRDYKTGKLLYGFGPSLAPLGVRALELIAMAETARRETIAMGKLRVGIAALRRTLRSHLAVAMEEGVEGVIIDKAAAALQRIPIRINASESIAQLSHWHETMKTAAQELEARLSTENTAPEEPTAAQNAAQAEISCTTYTETKNNYPINGTSTKFTEGKNKTKTHDSLPIALIKQCLGDGIEQDRWPRTNNWHDIVNKMQERAIMLDIDQASWTQACSTLGRTSAAICAIILENRLSRQDASHVRNPRAYFNALIHRGLQDKLDMTASLRGIARRKSSRRVEENHSFHTNLKQHHRQSVAMP